MVLALHSSSSFAERTVLVEKKVTWETNFMIFVFVMLPCLFYAYYINVAKAGKVIELVKFVEHGNTELIF